jgi:SAM-dependent methyltransferase
MPSRSGNDPAERLINQYDAEARAYLDCWAPVIHPISCALINELPRQGVEHVLDVGAGVGLLLPVLQKKYEKALVVGVDRSEGMIALAGSTGLVSVMDALSLGIRRDVFDLAVMAFMLFHLPDPAVGLEETRRVLRPGGALGVTTWADDLDSPAVGIWNEELDAHGASSVESVRLAHHELMDSPAKVGNLLVSAGYVSVRTEVREFTHRTRPEEFLRLRTSVGATKQRLESLADNVRTRCVARAQARLSQLSADDFTMRMRIVLASARCPY